MMPHRVCLVAEWLVASFAVGDLLIAIEYIVIPAVLLVVAREASWLSREIRAALVSITMFVLACGATHFMDVVTLWLPWYHLQLGVDVVTVAAGSVSIVLLIRSASYWDPLEMLKALQEHCRRRGA